MDAPKLRILLENVRRLGPFLTDGEILGIAIILDQACDRLIKEQGMKE